LLSERREKSLVLVVDDDTAMRMLERASLEQAGFAVEEAENGVEALAAIPRLRPDAVLLDVMMPGMDGFETCRELRKLPGCDLTPVLMVTGLDDTESIDQAYQTGATHFITKPINWGLLGHYVRYLLRAGNAFENLRKSERKNEALLNALPDLMLRLDRAGVVLEFKGTRSEARSRSLGRFVGKPIQEMLPGDIALQSMNAMERAFLTNEAQVFEYQLFVKDSKYFYEARVVVSGEDEILAIIRDITERKRAEEQILHLAYFDTLTGLANRILFKDRLTQSIERARRDGKMVAVLFLDLDRFKFINDTLGHDTGDILLKEVAGRIGNCLRKSDAIGRPCVGDSSTVLSRLGGDEFSVLLCDIESAEDAARIVKRLIEEVSKNFALEQHEIFVTASAGVALYPHDGEDAESLLKNADTAMYNAKEQGRNNAQFYTQSMNAKAYERLAMETNLRKALERQEFVLFYQPQVDLATGAVTGVEALIRWHHPELGMVSPAEFIPMAEETGLIVPIGDWVLRTACLQAVTWRAMGVFPIRVAVNLSAHQLRKKDLVRTVSEILEETHCDPRLLELEVTESAVMHNADSAISIMNSFKKMGMRIAIDDFGTGYSSLGHLRSFPVDILKIDRSFVKDISTSTDDAAITSAIIAMAGQLNLKTIAEGVETEEQLAFLRDHRCHEIQGYFVSPPVSADAVLPFLMSYNINRGLGEGLHNESRSGKTGRMDREKNLS
jgi:diguanylate cyclase (GGDEF)-like protein